MLDPGSFTARWSSVVFIQPFHHQHRQTIWWQVLPTGALLEESTSLDYVITDEGSTPKGFLWLLSIRPKFTTVFTIHLNCVLGGTTRLIWCSKSIAQNVKLCSLTAAHKKLLLMSKIRGSLKAKLLHVAVKATATFFSSQSYVELE